MHITLKAACRAPVERLGQVFRATFCITLNVNIAVTSLRIIHREQGTVLRQGFLFLKIDRSEIMKLPAYTNSLCVLSDPPQPFPMYYRRGIAQ